MTIIRGLELCVANRLPNRDLGSCRQISLAGFPAIEAAGGTGVAAPRPAIAERMWCDTGIEKRTLACPVQATLE